MITKLSSDSSCRTWIYECTRSYHKLAVPRTDPILKNGILKQRKRRCRKVLSETLSLIFVCGEFRSLTHHKPLEVVYEKRNANASASKERWDLRLQPYKFRIVHKAGAENAVDYVSPGTLLPRVYVNKRQRRRSTEVFLYMYSSIPKAMTIEEMVKQPIMTLR